MTADAEELALVAAISAGDRQALAVLYRRLEEPVFRFVRSRLDDPFEAGDVLQDVFLEVWKGAARFEGRSRVRTWVLGIAYRKLVDVHRRRRREGPDEVPDIEDESPDAEACLAAAEEGAHVRHCLEQLKADHRTTIALAFYEDLSYPEIAEVTGVPTGTVKTRAFHAKRLLMRCLEGLGGRRRPA